MKTWKDTLTGEYYIGDRLRESDIEIIVDDVYLNEWKVIQKQKITEARYHAEVSGVKVGEVFIDTDRTTQNRISQAFSLTQLDPDKTFNWKTADNEWKVLTADDVRFLSETIGEHVQTCFDKEMMLHIQIDECEHVEDVLNINW